jgi:uncharacterized membrane-anchored protein YhcB (DUF1043 family)
MDVGLRLQPPQPPRPPQPPQQTRAPPSPSPFLTSASRDAAQRNNSNSNNNNNNNNNGNSSGANSERRQRAPPAPGDNDNDGNNGGGGDGGGVVAAVVLGELFDRQADLIRASRAAVQEDVQHLREAVLQQLAEQQQQLEQRLARYSDLLDKVIQDNDRLRNELAMLWQSFLAHLQEDDDDRRPLQQQHQEQADTAPPRPADYL